MGKPDLSNVDDGAWWFVYIVLDIAVLLLDVTWAIVCLCVEIACWALAGGFDILFGMLGFSDDD